MRLISTGDVRKIAIIAATGAELMRLKRLTILKDFNASITLEPQKNVDYQCFMMVYTFTSKSQAEVFRLAYSIARKNGKLKSINRLYSKRIKKPPSYYAAQKARRKARRARKQRQIVKRRYIKLIPLLKAGNIATIEAKARQIARELLIADLL